MNPNVSSIIAPDSVSHASPGTSVSARGVRQEFDGGVVALDGIDLEVRAGELLAILGPSGCGKSTLLRIIAGLDRPTAGTISVTSRLANPQMGASNSDGRDLIPGPATAMKVQATTPSPGTPGEGTGGGPGVGALREGTPSLTPPTLPRSTEGGEKSPASQLHFHGSWVSPGLMVNPGEVHSKPHPEYRERDQDRADVAYVFQDAHLLPWRTVLRNVALPLELMGVARKARLETSQHAIEQVGLADAAGRYPNQLSGGMRMRASLARAMVTDPKLLLLDEPFAALDEITRQQLDEQLRGLWAARGMTVIFVTHSTAEAAFLATRAVVMSPRPGRIVLDRRIELPAVRNGLLRTTPEFARETRFLYEALEEGTNHP